MSTPHLEMTARRRSTSVSLPDCGPDVKEIGSLPCRERRHFGRDVTASVAGGLLSAGRVGFLPDGDIPLVESPWDGPTKAVNVPAGAGHLRDLRDSF